MAPSDPSPRPGDVLAEKYVLRERIGGGGMGTVFLAEHPALARRVAIKVLHPHLAAYEMFARRFRDEATAASRVQHRGSVAILDHGVTPDDVPFIAMELVPGRPLGQIIHEERLPLRRALGIFEQILDALDAAHACGVVHGDVKSDNFLVEPQACGDAVTMIDFGLACLDGAVASPGLFAGTPEYIAPELIRGAPPTTASDLYGAGVILYELLTGVTPFAGSSTSEILRRQVYAAVIPPSVRRPDRELPALLDQIVLRALDKDPHARFASAQELRNALAAVPHERGVPDRRPEHAEAARSEPAAAPLLDVAAVAARYEALAASLAGERRLEAAICELEEGIDVVIARAGSAGGGPLEPLSRLAASLAALYELAGQPGKARRVLACADDRGTLVEMTGSRVA